MNPLIDVKALEEMLKFLIKKFGEPEGEGMESMEGMEEKPEGEEDQSTEGLMSDAIEEIDDDYIKPENREVRIPKHMRPKKMAFSLSELAVGKPKDILPMEEESPRFKKKGRR